MKKMQNKIEEVTYPALLFLASQQKRNGGFLSLTTAEKNDFTTTKTYPTTFITSNILSCLNSLSKSSLTDSIRTKAAKYLLFQKSEFWSFNYWQRDSQEAGIMPYPDDLDDTFCALSAMATFDSNLITGKALSNVVKILTATETKTGGPYKTWLAGRKAGKVWHDVDLAVNANIARFMFLQKTELPNLAELFDKAIKAKKFTSAYYPEIFPVIYFISRSYKGGQVKPLIRHLLSLRQRNFSWGNPLNTALSVSTLVNLNFHKPKELEKSIGYLTDNFNGKSWQPYAFCLDPAQKGSQYYAGSHALTTAFCLEAMHKYLLLQKQTYADLLRKSKFSVQEERVYRKIISLAKKRFNALAPEAKNPALQILEQTILKDSDRQIVLLPLWFRQALGENGKSITDEQITGLGLANLYGWIAYTIYDDFFDGEGKAELLPVANIGLREVAEFYAQTLGYNSDKYKTVKKILDNMENANEWESAHCRTEVINNKITIPKVLPNFKNLRQLAGKSLGHALGPVAILLMLNFKYNSWHVKETLSFFTHYLIARQLNDDAHDWLEDLHAGRINSVGASVLEAADRKTINFQRDERMLQRLFWNDILPDTAGTVFKHVKLARLALPHIGFIEKPEILFRLLDRPETAAKEALEESKKMRDFLSSY